MLECAYAFVPHKYKYLVKDINEAHWSKKAKGYYVPYDKISKIKDRWNDIWLKFYELLNDFDFDRVAKIMKDMNWTYWGKETSPSVTDLKDMVKSLFNGMLERIMNDESGYSACGGFRLEYIPDEDQELRLTFEAITSSTFLIDDN